MTGSIDRTAEEEGIAASRGGGAVMESYKLFSCPGDEEHPSGLHLPVEADRPDAEG